MDKQLKQILVSKEIWDRILEEYSEDIEYVSSLDTLKCGYANKSKIYVCLEKSTKQLICQYIIVQLMIDAPAPERVGTYYQVICTLDFNQEKATEPDMTGQHAWNYVLNILRRYYKDKEIKTILQSCISNSDDIQFHYILDPTNDKVQVYQNCVKYDINGAHLSALIELFPKAKHELIGIRLKAKSTKQKKWKNIPNYFVGMLANKGFRNAMNWIINYVRKKVNERIDKIYEMNPKAYYIYGNTDGICFCGVENKIEGSSELGEFKIEYEGPVYFYRDDHIFVYQFGEEITGNILLELRDRVNLKEGKVVEFEGRRDETRKCLVASNVKEKKVKCEVM